MLDAATLDARGQPRTDFLGQLRRDLLAQKAGDPIPASAASTLSKRSIAMAKNPPPGPGRVGAVRDRTQTFNPRTQHWTKRDTGNGQFMDQKADPKPFKDARKEK